MKALPLILALAACAVAPSTSTTDQQLCRRDPVSGLCPTLTAQQAGAQSTAWVQDNYPSALGISVGCSAIYTTSGAIQGYECHLSFSWGGSLWSGECDVWTPPADDPSCFVTS